MEVRAPRAGSEVLLVKPDRGYTVADFRADTRASGDPGDDATWRALQSVRILGGAYVGGEATAAFWGTLHAGRYWLVSIPDSSSVLFETVHVHGTPTPSRFPPVTASAVNTGDAVHVTRSVPRSGRMQIRNSGDRVHDLELLMLDKGATYDDFIRAVHHPRHGFDLIHTMGTRGTVPLSSDTGYVLRYRLRPGHFVVLDSHTLHAAVSGRHIQHLRRRTDPMTVRRPAAAAVPGRAQ